MSVKKLISNLFLFFLLLLACDTENNQDTTPPGILTIDSIVPTNGGGIINYSLPSDSDILFVRAEYTNTLGNDVYRVSSSYNHSIEIDGLNQDTPVEVTLYVIDESQNVSDPVIALGFILIAVQTIISRQLDPFSNAVISITKISAGSAFNVIPDEAYIGGTLRTTNKNERNSLLKKIKKMAEETALSHNCKINFKINPGYPPTINNEEKSLIASNVFKESFGKDMVLVNEKPTMTSEDFSYMLKERPGAYIWLGAGENSEKLHSPHFDFNDELLPIGAQFWKNLVHQVLN